MFKGMFQDEKGNQSSMRFVWSVCVLTIFFVWAWMCIKNNQLYSFEIGDATLIGMLFGGKIGQKYLETKQGEKNEEKNQ